MVFLSLVTQHGFSLPPRAHLWFHGLNFLLALLFCLDLVWALVKNRDWKRVLSVRRLEYGVLFLFWVLLLLEAGMAISGNRSILEFLRIRSPGALIFGLIELFLLTILFLHTLRAAERLFVSGIRPEMMLAGSFALLIAGGTVFLQLPNSSASQDEPVGLVDAFFTATSAACVTGLTVRDTGTDFSMFGQQIILAVFQVGGLGIITFVAFLSVFSTKTLPVPQMVIFRQVVNAPAASDLRRQFVGILLATGAIELTGILLLYCFCPAGADPLSRLHWAAFHAVSAFCNAGFALQSDSLVGYVGNPGIVFSIGGLIIFGGLGFLVIPELVVFLSRRDWWRRVGALPLVRRLTAFRSPARGIVPVRLTVQTRLSLTVMTVLLLAGVAGFWGLEAHHLLRDRAVGESALAAIFQSITARTAGFNTVPIEQLQPATLVFLMILMVIGANAVSTGGGIKTVSLGVLLLALRAMVTRRDRAEAFGRTIPARTVFAALSVFVLYCFSAVVGVFLLSLTDPQFTLQQIAFEVISALSTVGLSLGITADLSPAGKLILCVAMFIGRVGPISMVLSIFQSRERVSYEFPEEEVVVG